MSVSERLVLDARIRSVLSERAFVAELENGHRFTAFVDRKEPARRDRIDMGDTVRVEFSTYDMTKGRITGPARAETEHESA